jgi:hypothetical protein
MLDDGDWFLATRQTEKCHAEWPGGSPAASPACAACLGDGTDVPNALRAADLSLGTSPRPTTRIAEGTPVACTAALSTRRVVAALCRCCGSHAVTAFIDLNQERPFVSPRTARTGLYGKQPDASLGQQP